MNVIKINEKIIKFTKENIKGHIELLKENFLSELVHALNHDDSNSCSVIFQKIQTSTEQIHDGLKIITRCMYESNATNPGTYVGKSTADVANEVLVKACPPIKTDSKTNGDLGAARVQLEKLYKDHPYYSSIGYGKDKEGLPSLFVYLKKEFAPEVDKITKINGFSIEYHVIGDVAPLGNKYN